MVESPTAYFREWEVSFKTINLHHLHITSQTREISFKPDSSTIKYLLKNSPSGSNWQ